MDKFATVSTMPIEKPMMARMTANGGRLLQNGIIDMQTAIRQMLSSSNGCFGSLITQTIHTIIIVNNENTINGNTLIKNILFQMIENALQYLEDDE